MFTSRSRGIDRTDVWPCPGSKRTSRIVSLCGGSVRSSESLDLARRSEPSTRYVCGPPEYRSSPGGGGTLFLKISSATPVAVFNATVAVAPPLNAAISSAATEKRSHILRECEGGRWSSMACQQRSAHRGGAGARRPPGSAHVVVG